MARTAEQRRVGHVPPRRTFYPRWQRPLAAGSAFFAVIGLAGAVRAGLTLDTSVRTWAVAAMSLAMSAAGLWLARGLSWPWSGPAVTLSDAGVTLWPQRRNALMIPWPEVAAVRIDGTNRRVHFDVLDANRHPARLGPFWSAPSCPLDLHNATREDFLVVIDEYWRKPARVDG